MMSALFIDNNDRVLELGGNIGRNSLVIASMLANSKNLVVFESDPISAEILERNKNANGFKFTIHSKALSNKPLIQTGWDSRPLKENEEIPEGWFTLDTMSISTLIILNPIPFNVLVCDCEGCLYHILKDEPTFLDMFNKVLLENDFWNEPEQEQFIHHRLKELGFQIQFQHDLDMEGCPQRTSFWQAWIR
jgi:FkbM family methyltransferase